MSHTTIYFLAKAKDFEQAENRVTEYLEGESFFDDSKVLHGDSGPLEQKRGELLELVKNWDWKKNADGFLDKAEKCKADGNFGMYGYNLIKAGELYAQYLTIETYVFNIETSYYSLPDEDENWWAVDVDFHY
jgi:hypothetical protein